MSFLPKGTKPVLMFHAVIIFLCLHLCESGPIVSLQDVGKGGALHSTHCFQSRPVFLFPLEAGNRKPWCEALIFVMKKCAAPKGHTLEIACVCERS